MGTTLVDILKRILILCLKTKLIEDILEMWVVL